MVARMGVWQPDHRSAGWRLADALRIDELAAVVNPPTAEPDAALPTLGREFEAGAGGVAANGLGLFEAEEIARKIHALPTRTVAGLAVKAQVAIPTIWSSDYEPDVGLGE